MIKTPEVFSKSIMKKVATKRIRLVRECDSDSGDLGGGWYEC